ncbi:MAG: NADH-quinone oxidoreductase subunit C [Acidimicrobiia bacterium]|nr:NADH-quinone oxidoreductase subunit C [Acidimicrobiia bacterium]
MSDTPDTPTTETDVVEAAEHDGVETGALQQWADALVEELGALGSTVEFDTVRIHVDPARWVETINQARKKLELFSWLSAIDWSKDVEVGDPVDDVDTLEERFEVLCRLSSVENADGAIFVAVIDRENPFIDSLMPTIGGAEWHEREAHEMFGIDFVGNTNLIPLYLPDDFIGNPLLKSYPLLSREVKPWPGDVDVEPMPELPEIEATDDVESDTEGEES